MDFSGSIVQSSSVWRDIAFIGITDSVAYTLNRYTTKYTYDEVAGYHVRDGHRVTRFTKVIDRIGVLGKFVSGASHDGNLFIISHDQEIQPANSAHMIQCRPSDSAMAMKSLPLQFGGRPQATRFGNRIFLFGIWLDAQDQVGNLVYAYDTDQDTWSFSAPSPVKRSLAGAAVIGSKAYIVGGFVDPATKAPTGLLEEYPLDP
jgi:hypothetical protein